MDGATLRQLGLDHWHGCDLDDLYQQRTLSMKPTETEAKTVGKNVLRRVTDVSGNVVKCRLTLLPV